MLLLFVAAALTPCAHTLSMVEEFKARFGVGHVNEAALREAARAQGSRLGVRFGLTELSGMSQEQFERKMLVPRVLEEKGTAPFFDNLEELPSSLDWCDRGCCSPVTHQSHGNCWAHVGASVLAGRASANGGTRCSPDRFCPLPPLWISRCLQYDEQAGDAPTKVFDELQRIPCRGGFDRSLLNAPRLSRATLAAAQKEHERLVSDVLSCKSEHEQMRDQLNLVNARMEQECVSVEVLQRLGNKVDSCNENCRALIEEYNAAVVSYNDCAPRKQRSLMVDRLNDIAQRCREMQAKVRASAEAFNLNAAQVNSQWSAYALEDESNDQCPPIRANSPVIDPDASSIVTMARPTTTQLRQALQHGPVGVLIAASAMKDYVGGIMKPGAGCPSGGDGPLVLDHWVTLVGYGEEDGTPFLRFQNSWGTLWGEDGFFRVSTEKLVTEVQVSGQQRAVFDAGACGIRTHLAYANGKIATN